jgi:hypothetical protein
MNPQALKENLRLYIQLEEAQAKLNQELYEIYAQKRIVENVLSDELPRNFPEDFVFPHEGKFYRFLMDVEDGGIRNFAEMENFDTWLSQQEPKSSDPEDLAMDELRKDSHQEYYRPSGSTELVQIPESPELDELRNELYSAEILLGGGE